jgi:membrane fusion protein, copper/silver efflux system
MHWKSWYTAVAGLVLGVAIIALLPRHALFTDRDPHAADVGETGERYACPMMDFIGKRPGPCPVCGMQMGKVTAGELNREQRRRMGVQTSRVTEGPAVITIRAYGTADYDHRFTQVVIPRVSGRIVKRYDATFGCCQEVDAGESIIDLYSPELISAQGEFAAAVKLGNAPLVAALRERFVRWNLEDVAEEIQQGGAIRDTVTIRSPFGGQVLLRDFEGVNEALEVGREVKADTPLLRLVDGDRLALIVNVPETRARFLAEGQAVEIESDDRGPLPEVKGVIGRLATEIAPELRTREVRIYLTGARSLLQPGSLVSAKIRAALDPQLQPADPMLDESWGQFALVPKTAVLSTGVRHVAWRLAERQPDGRVRFELAALALGPRIEDENGNDLFVVRAGLKPGDEVATQGAFLIDSQAQLAGTTSLLFPLGAVAPTAGHQH